MMELLLLLAAGWTVACGDPAVSSESDEDGGVLGDAGSARTEMLIGSAGGTVTLPDGASVEIPEGALDGDLTIAIERFSLSGMPDLPAGFRPISYAYAFTPHGTSFSVNAAISIPINGNLIPINGIPINGIPINGRMFRRNNLADMSWEEISASFSESAGGASIPGFSFYVAAYPEDESTDAGVVSAADAETEDPAAEPSSSDAATPLAHAIDAGH